MKLTSQDFFFCYTIELSKYLSENGVPYIFKGRSIKDNSIFTLYQKSDELQDLLTNFKSALQ